ncbi:MAG TPA: EamA family transporter [Microvirga sp.]|jgi:drug/metabolite transporter (DMT)-like permease
MPILVLSAALAASAVWAASAILAHAPARALGTVTFTRVQLTAVSLLLAVIVTATGGWATLSGATQSWAHGGGLLVSGFVGVFLGNMAWAECIRRGGPRRVELLGTLSAPIAALLGLAFFGEALTGQALVGSALALGGVAIAVAYGRREGDHPLDAAVGAVGAMVGFGLLMALCRAVGFVAVKPALAAGTDPWAVSLFRTASAGLAVNALALWPATAMALAPKLTPRIVAQAVLPGVLGYVVATTLLLYALRHYETGIVVVLGSLAPILILPLLWMKTREAPTPAAWTGAGLAVAGAALILAR